MDESQRRKLSVAVGVLLSLAVVGSIVIDGADARQRVEDYARGESIEPYLAGDGGFRAEFPTTPERRMEKVDVGGAEVDVVDYTSGSGDGAFTVSFADIPAGQEVGDPILRLDASAKGAAAAVKGTLTSSMITTLVGLPAVEYLIVLDGRNVKATSVLSGRRLYGVQVVGRENPPLGYDRFRASFRLAT